jgi:hypothetical protein
MGLNNMDTTNCTQCGGPTSTGFVLETAIPHARTTPIWVEGEPENASWGGLKVKDRANYPIVAYRCTKCGHLELYANIQKK